MQNENSFFGSLFSPQRVIPRVRLKITSWKGNRRNKCKEGDDLPYFGVSYRRDDVQAHLVPVHQKSQHVNFVASQQSKYPQLQTFRQNSANNGENSYKESTNETKLLTSTTQNYDSTPIQKESGSSQYDVPNNKYFKHSSTTNWLVNEGEENTNEVATPRRRNTTDKWDDVIPIVKHPQQRTDQKSGVELLLEVNQYIKDIFMWLDYQKNGYVTYNAVKILCQLLNKSYPDLDDTCNSVSENDKCADKFCKQHLRFEKFSFILRYCFEKEENLLPNLVQRQSSVVSGVPRRLELLKNIISSINKLDSYRKFWCFSEESNARNGLDFDAFKNSNISIISREVELKRRILFQQQEINGLREIIEGLRIALQSSDAENLCLHVRLQLKEDTSISLQPFYAKAEHQDERAGEIRRSYSCESLESGFQTSFESVSKLKQDQEMSQEYNGDSEYQNQGKDDDVDYLRRKLRKAYSKIHRVNRELESLRFMMIDNKKDKERIKELQSQMDDMKAQMRQKDILYNNSKKECASLKSSRSRMITELFKVRAIISDLCSKMKIQEDKTSNNTTESFSMTTLDYGSSTESLDRYSETCLLDLGCDRTEWNNIKDDSSESTSTLNLSSKSEEEGEYLVSHSGEPRFLPKPPRNPNSHIRNLQYNNSNIRSNSGTFSNSKDSRIQSGDLFDDGLSYYKCTEKVESKKILDNLENEMKLLQYNLDNSKW